MNDLEAQVKAISDAKQKAQTQWETKESQLCAAIEEERTAHEGIVREIHDKHGAICQTHKAEMCTAEKVRKRWSKP